MENKTITNKATKEYFDMNAGVYCGLLLEKRLAIRMAKLLARQTQEIQELLTANIEETEISEWTLAYPDKKQTTVRFYKPNATNEDKLQRVSLFNKVNLIKKIPEVYIAHNMKSAERAYLEYHNKLDFLGFDPFKETQNKINQ